MLSCSRTPCSDLLGAWQRSPGPTPRPSTGRSRHCYVPGSARTISITSTASRFGGSIAMAASRSATRRDAAQTFQRSCPGLLRTWECSHDLDYLYGLALRGVDRNGGDPLGDELRRRE